MTLLLIHLLTLFSVLSYPEVRSEPMSVPNHPQRWYELMTEQWSDQKEHLKTDTRLDGVMRATPDSLRWQNMYLTSNEMMPMCILGNRLYMVAHTGIRKAHLQVNDSIYDMTVNVPLQLGRYSILMFDEKVARIAFPIHGRMVYGHRIGMLYTDIDGNIWEEVWRKAKQIHEEKETHVRNRNQKTTQRIDEYHLRCNLGEVDARMHHIASHGEPESWTFTVHGAPYIPQPDDVEQHHYPYLEISFEGAGITICSDETVIAQSDQDNKPLYLPLSLLHRSEIQMQITPHEDGRIDMKSLRLVECVHELVQ